jgi:phosphopantothenoylcysteine decarboxylase/phosphopantothenate--cysteine ligase
MQVLLGISGGIAAYKGPEVVRALRRKGHAVRCALTENATRLVAPDALTAVSGQRTTVTMWPGDGTMPHIDLARWANALVIAPATADCLAKLALGLADDLLSTLFLALEPHVPVWLAPAMNTQMWQKPIVQAHLKALREGGAKIIAPVEGELACGESGVGAMASPEAIAAALG